jgi:hypothetical protein
MPQKPQPNEGPTLRDSFHLGRLALSAHERCATPPIRDQVGTEANTLAGPLALVGMALYGAYVHDGCVFLYIGFWLVAMLSQRMDSIACRRRGMLLHSRYAGRPFVALLLAPFIRSERVAKLLIEPAFCLASAWMLADWSPAVAGLVGSAAFSIVMVELLDGHMQKQREQAVIDSRLEMQDLANGVRQRFGDFR